MAKIEITDEMALEFIRHWYVVPSNASVEDFVKCKKALKGAFGEHMDRSDSELAHMIATARPGQVQHVTKGEMERISKGLYHPPEPEIVVTDEMLGAGIREFWKRTGSPDIWDCLRDAYRAMRRLEPKPSICGELEDGA